MIQKIGISSFTVEEFNGHSTSPGELRDLFGMWSVLTDALEGKIGLQQREKISWAIEFDRIDGFGCFRARCELRDGDRVLVAHGNIHIFAECCTDAEGSYGAAQLGEKIANILRQRI